MDVELRERKWCGVLGIEKVGVEGYWKKKTIANGLRIGSMHYAVCMFFYAQKHT